MRMPIVLLCMGLCVSAASNSEKQSTNDEPSTLAENDEKRRSQSVAAVLLDSTDASAAATSGVHSATSGVRSATSGVHSSLGDAPPITPPAASFSLPLVCPLGTGRKRGYSVHCAAAAPIQGVIVSGASAPSSSGVHFGPRDSPPSPERKRLHSEPEAAAASAETEPSEAAVASGSAILTGLHSLSTLDDSGLGNSCPFCLWRPPGVASEAETDSETDSETDNVEGSKYMEEKDFAYEVTKKIVQGVAKAVADADARFAAELQDHPLVALEATNWAIGGYRIAAEVLGENPEEVTISFLEHLKFEDDAEEAATIADSETNDEVGSEEAADSEMQDEEGAETDEAALAAVIMMCDVQAAAEADEGFAAELEDDPSGTIDSWGGDAEGFEEILEDLRK